MRRFDTTYGGLGVGANSLLRNGLRSGSGQVDQITKSRQEWFEYLVIAGGGGGGSSNGAWPGGAGGAGGYRSNVNTEMSGGGTTAMAQWGLGYVPIKKGTLTVTVGGGGAAAANGANSVFDTVTTTGGGRGGNANGGARGAGGSGGGSGADADGPYPIIGGAGTANEGFIGGSVYAGNGGNEFRPGGGAGDKGGDIGGGTGGSSAGVASAINGTSTTRGVGGPANLTANPGSPNTGNGGASSGYTGGGGAGGSGIVIVRYLTGSQGGYTITGGTITTVGAYTVHTFTGSGSLTVA